jgi:tetratricopeptide (TPR) repeat protein
MRLTHTLAALRLWALLFAMTAPPPGHAADDFTVAYQRWKSLESQGQWAAALTEAEKVRSIALKQYGTDHAHTGRVLTELAGLYVDCGRYKQAQEAGRRALAINEKEHGKESAAVATAMLHLGRAEIWLRNFAKGKDYLKRCRQLFEQNNAKHPSLVLVTREQCLLHADADESVEALESGKESVTLAVDLWGEDHVEVALSQLRLGHALRAAGELQQSEATLAGGTSQFRKQVEH